MRMTVGILASSSGGADGGQVVFTSADGASQTWVVPDEVHLVSAVAASRGAYAGCGLTWTNDIPVTPGETLHVLFPTALGGKCGLFRHVTASVYIDLVFAENPTGTMGGTTGGLGGLQRHAPGRDSYGGGNGGAAAMGTSYGGGGAAGYSGNGGVAYRGASLPAQPGSGGGGGGGGSVQGGGGVGLLGVGESGSVGGGGGSGGASVTPGILDGGDYGGGGVLGLGAPGAVRIIWGGGRSYPNNAGDV